MIATIPSLRSGRLRFLRPNRATFPGCTVLATTLLLAFLGAPSLEAKKLSHRGTGFKVQAPSGFKLKARKGIYRISKGRESVTLMRLHSPLSVAETAKSFVKDSKMKRPRTKRKGKKGAIVTGTLKGKAVLVEFKQKGAYVDVAKYIPAKRGAKRSAKLVPAVTLADVAILRRIVNSRRGGIVAPLQVTVPMRRFTQGGASAMVPNIPGWVYSGAVGGLDGGRPDQGSFALGIGIPMLGYVPSNQCITNVWPSLAPGLAVTGIAPVPGSAGSLGPSFESAFYNVRFTFQGRTYQALFLSGSNHSLFYYSYIAVAVGGPTGIGPALLDTWRTWDPTPALNARLNQITQTILTTPIPGNPIDPKVFDERQAAWTEYIRM